MRARLSAPLDLCRSIRSQLHSELRLTSESAEGDVIYFYLLVLVCFFKPYGEHSLEELAPGSQHTSMRL